MFRSLLILSIEKHFTRHRFRAICIFIIVAYLIHKYYITVYNLFYFTLIHNFNSDNMLRTVFMPQCSAVDLVYHLFDVYVHVG